MDIQERWETIIKEETKELKKKWPLASSYTLKSMALETAIPKILTEITATKGAKSDTSRTRKKAVKKTVKKSGNKKASGGVRIARRDAGELGH